ncbi:MAG: hypothetical protein ABIJ46_04505 [bacterium]
MGTRRKKEQVLDAAGRIRPYLAESGRVLFVAALVVLLAGAGAETVVPGLVFNQLSPQLLAGVMLVSGALSLLSSAAPRGALRRIAFGILGLAGVAAVWSIARGYFLSLGDGEGTFMVVATSVVAGMVVLSALPAGRGPVRREKN